MKTRDVRFAGKRQPFQRFLHVAIAVSIDHTVVRNTRSEDGTIRSVVLVVSAFAEGELKFPVFPEFFSSDTCEVPVVCVRGRRFLGALGNYPVGVPSLPESFERRPLLFDGVLSPGEAEQVIRDSR